jgi:hypothetical protein
MKYKNLAIVISCFAASLPALADEQGFELNCSIEQQSPNSSEPLVSQVTANVQLVERSDDTYMVVGKPTITSKHGTKVYALNTPLSKFEEEYDSYAAKFVTTWLLEGNAFVKLPYVFSRNPTISISLFFHSDIVRDLGGRIYEVSSTCNVSQSK